MQVSQSELDLEKFAASILLDEGPLPAGENLGQARASDSSLQGSNSEWEAMLVDNLSVATSITGSAPEHGSASGTALFFTQGVHAVVIFLAHVRAYCNISALTCATTGDGTPDVHVRAFHTISALSCATPGDGTPDMHRRAVQTLHAAVMEMPIQSI